VKKSGSESGAAAVEFAIVLPLLLLLLFGMVDFGRLFFLEISLQSSAREAARVSSFIPGTGSSFSYVFGGSQVIDDRIRTIVDKTTNDFGLPGFSLSSNQISISGIACKTNNLLDQSTLDEDTSIRLSIGFVWITPISIIDNLTSLPSQVVVNSFARCIV
jgi:hypothetical protein